MNLGSIRDLSHKFAGYRLKIYSEIESNKRVDWVKRFVTADQSKSGLFLVKRTCFRVISMCGLLGNLDMLRDFLEGGVRAKDDSPGCIRCRYVTWHSHELCTRGAFQLVHSSALVAGSETADGTAS